MTLSDKELIKKIKKGNQSAFKELYVKYSDLLYTFISHQLKNNKETASDIWQETWSVVITNISEFKHKSSVFTWLCAIAKNKISDFYRYSEKEERLKNDNTFYIDLDYESIDIVNNQTQTIVIIVLAELKEKYSSLLIARYFENKSIEEISQTIKKSYKATESMLSRAREAFKKNYKKIMNSNYEQ